MESTEPAWGLRAPLVPAGTQPGGTLHSTLAHKGSCLAQALRGLYVRAALHPSLHNTSQCAHRRVML